MSNLGQKWLVNIICLTKRRSYLLTNTPELAVYTTKLLHARREDTWLVANQMYLRKEIIKIFRDATSAAKHPSSN